MAPEHVFLRAVQDSPEDDALRLVFADWLEENGQPERAEITRVQVEEGRLPEDDPRRKELEARASTLAARYEAHALREILLTMRSSGSQRNPGSPLFHVRFGVGSRAFTCLIRAR